MKAIEAGDEITSDYALFDYSCDGHEIMECLCYAPNCRKSMRGFRKLTLPEKSKLLHMVDASLMMQFLSDTPNLTIVDLDLETPEGVEINSSNINNCFLLASRCFKSGDIIFENESVIVTDPDAE